MYSLFLLLRNRTKLSFFSVSYRNVGQPAPENSKCENGHYQFDFPSGIADIKDFTLEVQRIAGIPYEGQATVNAYAGTTDWICKDSPSPDIKEECSWVGVLNIAV